MREKKLFPVFHTIVFVTHAYVNKLDRCFAHRLGQPVSAKYQYDLFWKLKQAQYDILAVKLQIVILKIVPVP